MEQAGTKTIEGRELFRMGRKGERMTADRTDREEYAALVIEDYMHLRPTKEFKFTQRSATGKFNGDLSCEELERMSQILLNTEEKSFDSDIVESQLYLCSNELQGDALRRITEIVGGEMLVKWLASSIMVNNIVTNEPLLSPIFTERCEAMAAEIFDRPEA